MKITIKLKDSKYLINGKNLENCNEIEKRCYEETVLTSKLLHKLEFELTINNYK